MDATTNALLADAVYVITPNPYTLTGDLITNDNGKDDCDPTKGTISLKNIDFYSL
jgi:hypothetical protein